MNIFYTILWFSYIYYFTFNVLLLILVFSALRMYSTYSSQLNNLYSKASFLFVSVTLFYFLTTLTALNYLLDQYSEISYLHDENFKLSLLSLSQPKLLSISSLSSFNFEVYLYPFIYVFLLVTVLSIVFCLTYNQDELYSFMFYCTLILMSGYTLFFTDSMIIFFCVRNAFSPFFFYII